MAALTPDGPKRPVKGQFGMAAARGSSDPASGTTSARYPILCVTAGHFNHRAAGRVSKTPAASGGVEGDGTMPPARQAPAAANASPDAQASTVRAGRAPEAMVNMLDAGGPHMFWRLQASP